MGYIRHDAVIVTSGKSLTDCHEKAVEFCGDLVSEVIHSINGQESFFIAPDGSKEGWFESDNAESNRQHFLRWLKENSGDEHSFWPDYLFLNFGGDGNEAVIVEDSLEATQ